ncbi:MAG: hypothetical protein K2K83_03635 [Rikenella sp.]|nr:hypothetical protein [Rikenella sp.]
MNCGQLSKSLTLAACGSSTAAIKAKIIIGNHDDIDKDASKVADGVCSELMLTKSSGGAFLYESHRNAFEANCTLAKGTYQSSYDHQIVLRIFVKSQEAKDELNKLKDSKVFVITEGEDARNPETRFEIYGFDNGLVLTDLQAATTDSDGVIYTVTLASNDNSKESGLPVSLWAGSIEATRAAVDALVHHEAAPEEQE